MITIVKIVAFIVSVVGTVKILNKKEQKKGFDFFGEEVEFLNKKGE